MELTYDVILRYQDAFFGGGRQELPHVVVFRCQDSFFDGRDALP